LLVAPTCCDLLEKIKNIGRFTFCPCPDNGDYLGNIWTGIGGCFGFHPDFGWGFRSQVHAGAGGPGALLPSSSRNRSSLLRIIECRDCQLSWFLVEQAEWVNLTRLAGTYWSCWIFLTKYPVVSFKLGSKKLHFHKVNMSNLNYLKQATMKFSSPALSKQGSSTRLLLSLLAPPCQLDYFSVQAVVFETRHSPFTTPS